MESHELVSSISAIISAGFDIRTEPYAQGMLAAIRAYLLKVGGVPSTMLVAPVLSDTC